LKTLNLALAAAALSTLVVSTPVLAGDAVVGKQKAVACIACHGSDVYPAFSTPCNWVAVTPTSWL
jgi:cytochrome c553